MSIEQSHFTRETFEHHFRGMTNSGVTEKDCTNCFVTVLLFLVLYKVFSYLSDVSSIGPTLASMTSRRQIQDGGPHDTKMAAPRSQIRDGGPCDAFGYTSEGESTP